MLTGLLKGLIVVLAVAGVFGGASQTREPARRRPPVEEGCRELPPAAPAAPATCS